MSRLRIEHPNILCEATDYSLPVLCLDKKKKPSKENSSEIGVLLKRLAKERMIGSIIQQTKSRKYSSGKRKVNSSMSNYEELEKKQQRKNTLIQTPQTFISAFDVSSIQKLKTKASKISLSPNRTRLPSINNSPRLKLKQISHMTWEKISKDGRLKKDLIVTYLSNKTYPLAAQTFIRFFEPSFESACFKFNQFLSYLLKLSDITKKFFEFQILDLDNDGIISPKDILDIYLIITQSQTCSEQFIKQIDKLSQCMQQYLSLEDKPKTTRVLLQTIICDRNSTQQKLTSLINPEYKNQTSLKEYVHRSAYRHTFLMFGHNGKMRARTQVIDEAKNQINKIKFKDEKGLSFGVYSELPTKFFDIFVDMFTQREQQFNLILK